MWPPRGAESPRGTRAVPAGGAPSGPRVVRVGTHALRQGSTSTLSGRLRQHRGVTSSGGGGHRGSVFRQHVGRRLAVQHPELAVATWGVGASAEIRGSGVWNVNHVRETHAPQFVEWFAEIVSASRRA